MMDRRWSRYGLVVLAALLVLPGCARDVEQTATETAETTAAVATTAAYDRGDALISPAELKAMLDGGETPVIIAVVKDTDFAMGHIPGAVQTWRGDYEPAEAEYGGMILQPAEFQEFARGLGVNDDSTVVVYDHKYDATRLWWAFYLYGKEDVKVLDGGYQGWTAAGYEVDRLGAPEVTPGTFTAELAHPEMLATAEDVRRCQEDPTWHLWDTREQDEWAGETMKKGAFREGRIPWAEFQNWKQFKQPVAEGEAPTAFADPSGIQQVIDSYGMQPDEHHVFYCQSGVRTTTNMFALYLMGFPPENLHNYDGSWIEWSYHEDNPIVDDTP